VSLRIPGWYALAGRLARGGLRLFGSERIGPWPPARTETVWIHAASLGEAKGPLSVLRFLPPGLPLTLTATTSAGLERLREAGLEVFRLPRDDRASVDDFLRSRGVRAALFLEAEAWPVALEALSRRDIPVAFAAFRSLPSSSPAMRSARFVRI